MEASTVPEVVAEALDSDGEEARNSDTVVAVTLERIAALMLVAVK